MNSHLRQANGSIKQRGFTLIEILITTLIFSFSMLSLTQLQTTASKYANSSALHHMATLQALNILEHMRADRVAVLAGHYNLTQQNTSSHSDSPSAQVLQQWQSELADLLPEGQGSIECSLAGRCKIAIFWVNIVPSQMAADNHRLRFELSSQL